MRKRYWKHRCNENMLALQMLEREYSNLQNNAFHEYIVGLVRNAKNDPVGFWTCLGGFQI